MCLGALDSSLDLVMCLHEILQKLDLLKKNCTSVKKISKIKISRDSGGVRSSTWDMLYLMDDVFDFRRKHIF